MREPSREYQNIAAATAPRRCGLLDERLARSMRLFVAALAAVGCTAASVASHAASAKPPLAGVERTPADELFLQAREAAKSADRERLNRLAPALAGHPLAAWVDYWRLQAKLRANDAEAAEIQAFVTRHADTYLSDRLRADWLIALGVKGDMVRFEQEHRALVWTHDEPQLRCYVMLMRYQRNEGRRIDELATEARRVLATSTAGGGEGCTALADTLIVDQRLSTVDRMRMLIDQNQMAAVQRLATGVNATLWPAIDRPAAWLKAQGPDLTRAPRTAVMLALARLARDEPEDAARLALGIDSVLNAAERASLWGRIGHMGAVKLLPQAVQWYRRGGAQVGLGEALARPDEMLEWQMRAALRNEAGSSAPDWSMVRSTFERMTEEQRKEPAWQYWRARALLASSGGALIRSELSRHASSATGALPSDAARAADTAAAQAALRGGAPAIGASGSDATQPGPGPQPASASPIGAALAGTPVMGVPPAGAPSAGVPPAGAPSANDTAASPGSTTPNASPLPSSAAGPSLPARREAIEVLRMLSGRLDFYGLLALDELGERFVPPANPLPPSAAEIAIHATNPGFGRALRLARLGMRPEAAREWSWALRRVNDNRSLTDRQLLAVAEYARSLDLPDRMISTSERTRFEIDFSQRFPTPHLERVRSYAAGQSLPTAFVYGLMRQESRFIADARSSSGAQGLMQLMPATARFVAKKLGLNDFSVAQVTDLDINLRLGTSYLKMVLDDLDGAPALAAAAYNAGPGRPRAWRATLPRPVEGAIFAESIPFAETRDYVKRVLANTVHYTAHIDGQAPSLKERLGTVVPRAAGQTELP